MRRKAKATAAVALSAVFACGLMAGCEFVTTNNTKDFSQVVAEIDITKSEDFAENGSLSAYKKVIRKAEVSKRDLVAAFLSYGSNMYQQYGSYAKTFEAICDSLVNQQINIQYAIIYLLQNDLDDNGNPRYTMEGYDAAVQNSEDQLAGLKYFLTPQEQAQGLYTTRRLFNNTLDSRESRYITATGSSSSSSGATARTLPTGANGTNSNYYDEAYKVYTGSNSASNCGGYETVDGSSVTSRKKAFNTFLGNLLDNDLLGEDEKPLIEEGEHKGELNENLFYFQIELRTQYETILLNKLSDLFEKTAEKALNERDLNEQFETDYNNQKASYQANVSSFESSLDSISDSNFILTAPKAGYGYVVNILLPFSTSQSAALTDAPKDQGDPKGNKFTQRASLLKNIVATDQRESWITGDTDHSFKATEPSSPISDFYGKDNSRTHLFFKDSLIRNYDETYFATANDTTITNYTNEYTAMDKYYGRYSFNGTVEYNEEKNVYTIEKKNVKIDDFIGEMNGYMNYAFKSVFNRDGVATGDFTQNYYSRTYSDYYKTGENGKTDYNNVDYSKFVYYKGKVNFKEAFDANKIFLAGSEENLAFSVMNELSFAYNTDTAGLNPYLGYSVVTGKTNYMPEFEYAAQQACIEGAGTIIVSPTDYGWHIVYCTFSFLESSEEGSNGEIKPFTFDYSLRNTKGTTSNLYYEMWKSKIVSDYSDNMQTAVRNAYNNEDCVTVYKNRYASFAELDNV